MREAPQWGIPVLYPPSIVVGTGMGMGIVLGCMNGDGKAFPSLTSFPSLAAPKVHLATLRGLVLQSTILVPTGTSRMPPSKTVPMGIPVAILAPGWTKLLIKNWSLDNHIVRKRNMTGLWRSVVFWWIENLENGKDMRFEIYGLFIGSGWGLKYIECLRLALYFRCASPKWRDLNWRGSPHLAVNGEWKVIKMAASSTWWLMDLVGLTEFGKAILGLYKGSPQSLIL